MYLSRPLRSFLVSALRDETGVTAIEYGMIAALIAAVIVTVVGTLGGQLNTAFTTVSQSWRIGTDRS